MIEIKKIFFFLSCIPLMASFWIHAAQHVKAGEKGERERIQKDILEPLAAHLKLPVSLRWQADNHPNDLIAAEHVHGENQLLLHPSFASRDLSDAERTGLAGHEYMHFNFRHGEKARQRSKNIGYALLASAIAPSVPQMLQGQFPKHPMRDGLLGIGVTAVAATSYVHHRFLQDETETDVGTVHLFPPHFRVPEGLIESFKQQQQTNLADKADDIKDIMASNLPEWRKRRQIAAHPTNEIGDDGLDTRHPRLSKRIERLEQELFQRDNPKEYNRQKQERKEKELRLCMAV